MNQIQVERVLAESNNALAKAREEERRTGEAMSSIDRSYWEGYTEALEWILGKGK